MNYIESKNWVLTCSEDKSFKIWDILNLRCINTIENHHKGVVTKALMFNETTIVSCGLDGEIKFWDINGDMKDPIHTLTGLN